MLIHMFMLLLWSFYHNFFLPTFSFQKKKRWPSETCVLSVVWTYLTGVCWLSLFKPCRPQRSRFNVAEICIPVCCCLTFYPRHNLPVSCGIYYVNVCVYVHRRKSVCKLKFIYNICNQRYICYIYICGCLAYFSLSTELSYHVYINKLILLARGLSC